MSDSEPKSTEGELLDRAAQGATEAIEQLLEMYRPQLSKMVQFHIDPRLTTRVDASDVVQEALARAHQRIPNYLAERPIGFYPWLRQFIKNQLVDIHRQHIGALGRSVQREQLSRDDSGQPFFFKANVSESTSPSGRLDRKEQIELVQSVLNEMDEPDRELIRMRHLEQLSTAEVATILGIGEGAVKTRLVRAMKRFRDHLEMDGESGS